MTTKMAVVYHSTTKHILGAVTRTDTSQPTSVAAIAGEGFVVRKLDVPSPARLVVHGTYDGKEQLSVAELEHSLERDRLFRQPLSFVLTHSETGSSTEAEVTMSPTLTELKPALCKVTTAAGAGPAGTAKYAVWAQIQPHGVEPSSGSTRVIQGEIQAPANSATPATLELAITPPLTGTAFDLLILVQNHKPLIEVNKAVSP